MAKLSQYSLVLKIASIAQRRDNQLSCQNGILLSMIKTVSELAVSAKVLSTLARDKGAILLQVHPSSGTRPKGLGSNHDDTIRTRKTEGKVICKQKIIRVPGFGICEEER
jgi:hypothetical protein